jgi:hypothetical protein
MVAELLKWGQSCADESIVRPELACQELKRGYGDNGSRHRSAH